MLKKLFTALLLFTCSLTVFGQIKPRLGILPFMGGPGRDGETITTLLSFQGDILGNFNVVPMTNAATAMVMDQNFQMSGFPDSDTLARIGRMLNADYIVSGFIRYLGDRNLVITNIVNVETFEQVAGYYQQYRVKEEIPALLSDMAKTIINASRRNTLGKQRLAVTPFNVAREEVNVQEVETLAQMLAIEIDKLGDYIVLPRITTTKAAKSDLDYRTRGYYTHEEEAKALGWAVNAKYVLNIEVYSVGAAKMFSASVVNAENGGLVAEGSRLYKTISDGIPVMEELAWLLSTAGLPPAPPQVSTPVPVPQSEPEPQIEEPKKPIIAYQPQPVPAQQIELEPQPIQVQQSEQEQEPYQQEKPKAKKNARLWTLGASVGSSFAIPWVIATVHGTIAPFNYMFLELGCDAGFISRSDEIDFYWSLYPFAHLALFVPFNKGGWYLGAGCGYMMAFYKFPEGDVRKNVFAVDLTSGFNLFNFIDISYTLRVKPDFSSFDSMSHKASIGFTYRF